MEHQEQHLYTVGELARKAGVSVRTLQYYDQTGLLKSTLSVGGRRMYTSDDVIRLQQILFFKSFGFPLEEIAEKLLTFKSAANLEMIFTAQRNILAGRIEHLNEIVSMLDAIIVETSKGQEISLDKLMSIMELMKQGNPYAFVLRYFGSEQWQQLAERFAFADAQEESRRIFADMGQIVAEMNTLYSQGADPAGPAGQRLAERWWAMVTDFTKGDPGLLKTLVGVGLDIENWPAETKDFREAIQNFLGSALNIYLANQGLSLSAMEANDDQ